MDEAAREVAAPAPAAHPSFAEMTRVFLRIGLLSFGGPAGQIALMHRMLVEERRWISDARFLHALNFCMLLPGPEAQQLATYVGWLLHGTRGGLVAGTLFVLPGLAVILALSTAYALLADTAWLAGLFFGLKAAVLAIVVEALVRVSRRALKSAGQVAVAALAFLALAAYPAPFPAVVLAAGAFGFLAARGPATAEAVEDDTAVGRAVVAAPGLGRSLATIASFAAAWAAPILLLAAVFGTGSVFLPIAGFFSKMAVVTFGGAYAVLAYVAQQAVDAYGWLGPGEMLDGLALAETTPGPLILVLVFVGFLAAFRDPGALDPLAAGLLGGLLTTWVTFVPCFLWIFLGAPHVERLRRNRALAGALSAITAAVVGVILNLTLWFALHVLFRRVDTVEAGPARLSVPDPASLDPAAALLAAAAVVGLFGLRLGMVPVLAACGLAGLLLRLAL